MEIKTTQDIMNDGLKVRTLGDFKYIPENYNFKWVRVDDELKFFEHISHIDTLKVNQTMKFQLLLQRIAEHIDELSQSNEVLK